MYVWQTGQDISYIHINGVFDTLGPRGADLSNFGQCETSWLFFEALQAEEPKEINRLISQIS